MKPVHIKQQRQRVVRGLLRRQREIWKAQNNLGYIELKTPIRHGWYKEIIITENVDRYKNKSVILEIYNEIEKCFWGKTKEDAEKVWLTQTSKHLIYKGFPTVSKKQFNRLSFKAQSMCTSFQYRNECKKLRVRFYVRIPKGAYKIKFKRAYITHRKRIDALLKSENDLIIQKLNNPLYYNIAESCFSYRCHWEFKAFKQEKIKVKRYLKALNKIAIYDIINDNIL